MRQISNKKFIYKTPNITKNKFNLSSNEMNKTRSEIIKINIYKEISE